MVKAWCLPLCALRVLTDGWAAYPHRLRRAFREKITRDRKPGRCRVQAWPEIVRGAVITKTAAHPVVEVIRRMAQGTLERAEERLALSAGGVVLTPAFMERFNGTMRERLASLTRRSHHAAPRLASLDAGMGLVGWTSHFCGPHHALSRRAARAIGRWGSLPLTPAMAAGLTDHPWSVHEVLTVRVPPSPCGAPKGTNGDGVSCATPSPLLRLRKGAFCSSTSEGCSTRPCRGTSGRKATFPQVKQRAGASPSSLPGRASTRRTGHGSSPYSLHPRDPHTRLPEQLQTWPQAPAQGSEDGPAERCDHKNRRCGAICQRSPWSGKCNPPTLKCRRQKSANTRLSQT
jgi:hypothetical protein